MTVHPTTNPRALRRWVRDLREKADYLDVTGARLIKKHGKHLPADVQAVLADQLGNLRAHRQSTPPDASAEQVEQFDRAVAVFDESLTLHLGAWRKSPTREYVEAIAWAVLLTLGIRAFVFEAFKIPTGSMIPTLQIHDHLFVNKFMFGLKIPFTRTKFLPLRDPKPGEIVVFEYPYDEDADSGGKDLIKRVIGVPGDRVRLKDNVLWLNGKPVKRKILAELGECGQESMAGRKCRIAQECVGGHLYVTQHHVAVEADLSDADNNPDWPPPLWNGLRYGPHAQQYSPPDNPNFPDFVVPPGNLLVMGDNRDNSKDGRFFGLVPLDTVKGKAAVRWWAFDEDWYKPVWSRMFQAVHQDVPGETCDNWDPSK